MGSFKVEAASVSNDLFGAAYSNNIGPVSFNNCASSDPASCSGQSYKVTTFWDSSNPNWTYLTGYAWSDSIGWIAFSNSYVSTSGCPPIPNWYSCQIAYSTNTGVISGWGRAVSYGDGWDGWINFSGVTVGSAGPSGIRALSGNAWGSDIVGSLNMSGVNIKETPPTSSVTLVASPNQVGPDGSGASNQTTLIWSGQNVTSCTASASSSRGDWTGPLGTSGTKVVQVGPSVTYSIDCINNVTNQVASASAPVTTGVAPSDDLDVIFLNSFGKTINVSSVGTWSNTITAILTSHSGATNVSLFIDPNSGGPNPSEITDLSNYNIKVYSSYNFNVSGQCSGNVIFSSANPQSFSIPAREVYCVEVKSKLPVLPPTGPYGSYYNLFLVATSQNVTTPVNTPFGGNGFQVKVTNNTPTLTFVASTTPSSGLPYTGGPVRLNWDSTNTTDCTASTNWSTWAGSPTWAGAGMTPKKLGDVKGTASGNITNTETFTISCNYIGSPTPITASVVVTVPPDPALPTVSLTASQTKFTGSIGKPTLSWTSTKAVSCGPESWTKKTSTSGSEVVTVNTSTTFNLTCYNSSNGSTTDTVKITVIPGQLPEIYMSASPDTLGTGGGNTVISWDSRPYGTSCGSPTIGGSVSSPAWTTKTSAYGSQSGSQSVSLTTGSTYGISCSNSFGTTKSSITIPVANTPPAPAVLMQATLINGNNYKISWSSTDTTYCGNPTVSPASSNPWTTKDTVDGFENLSISVNTSFGITCYNSNGDSAIDNVSVTPAPPILPNIIMSAKPHSLGTGGGNTVISWDSRPYGTSCGSPTIGGSVSSPAWTTKTSAYGSQSDLWH
ncbi:MAG: hypothetical protein NTX85_00850 [Candidatus Nomurabacteria bacterium]|nr:hypothetical protein [Candidatus Nomurabacteria bacterium]